jgi:hypothetical protein
MNEMRDVSGKPDKPDKQDKQDKPDAIYDIDVTSLFGGDAKLMLDDTLRFLTIQVVIQFMFHVGGAPFWSAEFGSLLLFVTAGVLFYWLIVRKLVAII